VKLLLDTCVWGGAASELRSAGHDVVYVGDRSADPGDEAILSEAHQTERILVTLDKDFGELAVVRGRPHAGIVRLVGISARGQGRICETVLRRYGDELLAGAIVTASQTRVRIRPSDT
jgi:predicted nuclease of predicted toxin-antitoxin system